MNERIAIRDAYGQALKELGTVNDKIVVLEADVGASTKSAIFGARFPERYFNVGISELNMTNMAAGLALEGYIPFVNTFAVFMASRALDPIQSLIAYDKLNVRLCGTYCGLSDSYDGASHQAITDIAAVRAIPNMTVLAVCDPVETRKAVFALADYEGPVYLRLSRAPAPAIYHEDFDFQIGKGSVIQEGKDITFITTGTVLSAVIEAAKKLESEGISSTIVDMHTIKPIDEDLIRKYARETGVIVTAEEHSVYGGLGSAVAEVLAQSGIQAKLSILGMTDFGESGDLDKLLEKYGFDGASIAMKAKEVLA